MDDSGNLESPSAGVTVNTGSAPDTTPPTVTTVVPVAGATNVAGNATMQATFSEAMTASTINMNTFELRLGEKTGMLLGRSVTYNATSRIATLTPSPRLVGGQKYTAIVKGGSAGVKDAAGNPLAVDRVWSFTAEATPPTVSPNTPTSGATGVSRTANVTADFSEAMNAQTISGSTVELRSPNGTVVAAQVSYSATNRRVTINPNSTLASFTVYTVFIRGGAIGVKDLASNAMTADRTWTFRTRTL